MARTGKKEANDLPQMTDFPSQRRGNKGAYVTLIQANLQNRGYDIGEEGIDGIFGPKVEKALKEFQKDINMPMNGIVGPRMWEVLKSSKFIKENVSKAVSSDAQPITETPAPYTEQAGASYRVLVEGLTRYQADLLVKLLRGNTVCRVL